MDAQNPDPAVSSPHQEVQLVHEVAPTPPPPRGRSSTPLVIGMTALLAVFLGGFILLGLAAVAVVGLGSDDQTEEQYHSLARHGGDKVAVITVEGTWADRPDEDEMIDEENRRYAPLAMMLRARTLVDVDCWTEAKGQPIKPGNVVKALRAKLAE